MAVHAADHIAVDGLTWGDAFTATDGDFGGTLNTHVRTTAAEAQAIVDGEVSQEIGSSLFGWFLADGWTIIRVDRPDYVERNYLNGWHIFTGDEAGPYTFAVEAKAGAEAIFWTRVWLVGADVTLP